MNSEVSKTNFEIAWERVKQITGWAKYKDLAGFVGSSTESIAGVKKRGKFNLEWARKIANAYGSYTDYIMDGIGPAKRDDAVYPLADGFKLGDLVDEIPPGFSADQDVVIGLELGEIKLILLRNIIDTYLRLRSGSDCSRASREIVLIYRHFLEHFKRSNDEVEIHDYIEKWF